MNEFHCVLDAKALVAECPRWHPDEKCLYWVDIYEPSFNRLDPATGENKKWPMPERIGCFAFRRDGGIIAGMQSGIFLVDFADGVTTRCVFPFEPENAGTRFNDGRCDRVGRFWAGTVIESMDKRVSALYRYDSGGTCTKLVDKLICSNGLAFTEDGRTLYHSDSRQDYVWSWDVDPVTADISNQRVFLAMDIQEGRPDGAVVDSEGGYWISHVGGWHVARYTPDGKIDRVIGIPVQRPTACCLGGEDFRTLFVTSATYPLSASEHGKQPLAGGIFAIEVSVPGFAEPYFGSEGPQ